MDIDQNLEISPSLSSLLDKYSRIEDKIMEIIREMTHKKMIIDLDRVYNICLRELKIEGMVILDALNNLSKAKRIIFGQKIIRDFVLKNDTRRQIYQYIKKNIGINFGQIYRALKIHPKVLQWNLEILKRYDCVIEYKIKNQKIYAIEETPMELMQLCFFRRNDKLHAILKILFNSPCSIKELTKQLNQPYDIITYHIKALLKENIIEAKLEIDTRVFVVSPHYTPFLTFN